MLDELDEEDVKKLKYLAIFGVGIVVMLIILLYSLDVLGSGIKKKNRPRAVLPVLESRAQKT